MRELAYYAALESTPESYHERLSINDRFHLAVAAGAQNGLLLDQVRRCLTQHDRVLSLGIVYAVQPTSVPQHHHIVDAIERRDPAGARAAMTSHLEDSFRLVMDLISSGRIRGLHRSSA